jgi:DNA-binding response OmpR family regulator
MPTIVMVDDDRSMLDMTRDYVEATGWTFQGADTGAKGLALIESAKPDLILLDVNLPDMDGMTICRRLKQAEATRGTPVILVSGDRKKAEDILQGLDGSGADGYIVKPFQVGVLKAKIDAVYRPFQQRKAGGLAG